MELVLPRTKHYVADEKWRHAWDNITSLVTREELDEQFVYPALRRLEAFTKDHPYWIFGWSGGKDSWPIWWLAGQVLPDSKGAFAHYGVLEFPSMSKYFAEHTPPNIMTLVNPRFQNYDWIEEYQDRFLFPKNSKDTYYYATHGTHWAQQQLYSLLKPDAIVLGRRIADGNQTGDDGLMVSRKRVQYSPIYDWPHEAVLAFMHYYEMPLAPYYGYPNAWSAGTSNWAGLLFKEQLDGWAYLDQCDPELVEKEAPRFVSGREYLAAK